MLSKKYHKWFSVEYAYPYPEENCYLKSILEKDKVNQQEDNAGTMEPEVIIWRLNN